MCNNFLATMCLEQVFYPLPCDYYTRFCRNMVERFSESAAGSPLSQSSLSHSTQAFSLCTPVIHSVRKNYEWLCNIIEQVCNACCQTFTWFSKYIQIPQKLLIYTGCIFVTQEMSFRISHHYIIWSI